VEELYTYGQVEPTCVPYIPGKGMMPS